MYQKQLDVIVIGGGHAGVEASLAAAKMGCRTLLLTLRKDTIGLMSCNPAIGGVGKGQLVKEIDALGGMMGLAADVAGIQFRQLNASKGQAVRSSRCQVDRRWYQRYLQQHVCAQPSLDVVEDMVSEILVKGSMVRGVKTQGGAVFHAETVILAAGTFLKGRMHIGPKIIPGGRVHEPAVVRLTENMADLGFEIFYFKTGTPPRIDGRSIDFSRMQQQGSDDVPIPFSFRNHRISPGKQLVACFITHTTETTHDVIRRNFHLSPMYSGQIDATGVRYCPSIEDKLKKFSDKPSHQVFLEPEGLDTDLYYPNGISTGLPEDVQLEMVRSIPGLEQAVITTPGYSIEHAVFPPTQVSASLETKALAGLFFAGQVNGTTGYEEAGAQGMIAGINAALKVQGRPPFILGRHESYTGVLIDDLTTKGTQEPYRMFTSRVEHRLVVREDNADKRMAPYAFDLGLISRQELDRIMEKDARIDYEIALLKKTRIYPGSAEGKALSDLLEKCMTARLTQPSSLADVLKRPQVKYALLKDFGASLDEDHQREIDQIEYAIKYEGFIARQMKEIDRLKHIENIRLPSGMDFSSVPGLSIEIRQKLNAVSPRTLGQAHRISGVTPAAIAVLMVYLKKKSLERRAGKA